VSDQTTTPRQSPRPAWLAPLGLAVLLGGVFFFRLGDDVPLRTHECLLAATARNMLLNRPVQLADGSRPSPYLVPNFNDSPRLRKTPLAYWMVAAAAWAVGEVNAWSARLPSALAALATVLMVAAALARRHDRLTALVGAATLATMVSFLMSARAALADMPMTCFSTASLLALWMGVEGSGRRRLAWFVAAGGAAGLAMLAKGPAPALVFPLPYLAAAVVIVVRLVQQRRGTACRAPTTARSPHEWAWTLGGAAVATLVFLAVVLPWPAYVYLHVPQALTIWKAESVDRAAGDFGHEEPFYFYLIRLPVLIAPWTVFFFYGFVLAVRAVRGGTACRAPTIPGSSAGVYPPRHDRAIEPASERPWLFFVGAWLVGTLVGFSLAAGKQDHYILPLFPAAAIFVALGVREVLGHAGRGNAAATSEPADFEPAAEAAGEARSQDLPPLPRRTRERPARDLSRARVWLMAGHGVFFVGLGVLCLAAYALYVAQPAFSDRLRGTVARLATPGVLRPLAVLGAISIAGGVAAWVLASRRRLVGSLAVLLATFAATFLWAGSMLIGPIDRSSRAVDFARHVRETVPDNVPLFAYRGTSNSVIFYVARPMPSLAAPAGAEKLMAAGQSFYVITDDRYLPQLETVPGLVRVYHEADPYRPEEGLWLLKAPGSP
jgi:4-amino-4-deoxy-L-arabinose transferase-like glycosyltransferase